MDYICATVDDEFKKPRTGIYMYMYIKEYVYMYIYVFVYIYVYMYPCTTREVPHSGIDEILI
jgi:hypothetical protein